MFHRVYQEISEALDGGNPSVLETSLEGMEGSIYESMKRSVRVERQIIGGYQMRTDYEAGRIRIQEPIIPQERLLILGGGHIAFSLCMFAANCGFPVTVADDRAEFASKERFPDAEYVLTGSYAESIRKFQVSPYDFVVIVTRGHFCDAECLREFLSGTMPAYLGIIGSRRRVQAQFALLREEGYAKEKLDRVFTPIGLNIGGRTPGEIAVSILAEMIACKRLPEYGVKNALVQNESDLNVSVIKKLAKNGQPAAVATIIESKGSVPRKAGAKMLVRADGKIFGSIGGGRGEGIVIQEARGLIGTGCYKILALDFTADVAAADGMVCGGKTKILVEDLMYGSEDL